MKKIILLLLVFHTFTTYSQNFDKEWKEVIKYEIEGQTKSASEVVDQIYRKAHRKNDEVQIVKCFFYQSKFLQVSDENAQQKIIQNLRKEIMDASPTSKSVLSYLYANILSRYANHYSYSITRRTPVDKQTSTDFLTWTMADFDNEIKNALTNSLANEKKLRDATINDYKDIFEISPYTDSKNISLYDFIFDKTLDYYKSKINNWQYGKIDPLPVLYESPKEFIDFKTKSLSDKNLMTLLQLMQKNEAYFLKNNKDKLDFAYYKRIHYAYSLLNDKTLYINSLKKTEAVVTNDYLKQQIKLDRAAYYYSLTSKDSGNYYGNVLKLIDTILKSKSNPNALADAETIKKAILKKTLSFTVKKICYPNENLRAFVQFQNIDSVKISYYRMPVAYNDRLNKYSKEINSDKLVLDFIKKNNPIKVFTRTFPNKKDHFEYSTEILLEKLDTGNYLIFIETINEFNDNDISFVFDNVVATQFNFLKTDDDKNDNFYVVDRKSGKPIENVQVKNDKTISKTGKLGKISFQKKIWFQGINSYSPVYFIKDNDTLCINYNKRFIYKDEKPSPEIFEAKTMLYFDRAIYRPGQKVFYKGIVMQKKDSEKSIVPFITVHLVIEDPDGATLKEYNVQTNEFGSFSGEFEIPKNVLTGRFSITIEEPDDYEADTKYYDKKKDKHSFWDNVDYNDSEHFSFQVEEYKRPAFEIKFDEIKENYTIGDTIKIKGNAKTLAGSNLSNAKVAYTVSKRVKSNDHFYENETNYINTETQTDASGNFIIEFSAASDSISNAAIETINFNIDTDVTDTNGETRTAEKRLTVGKHTLKLNTSLNPVLFIEDKNKLEINTTTLNDYPINAKGESHFYAIEGKSFLINRTFEIPEIQTISKKTFQELFPFEAYNNEDYNTTEKFVEKFNFNTETSKTLLLSDLKKWTLGNYKVVSTAFDSNNNLISTESRFELDSKNKVTSNKKIFTFHDTTNGNPDYFEIVFYSLIPDLFITSRFYNDKILTGEEGIQLKNGVGRIKIKKRSLYNSDVNFHFSTFWENQYAQETYSIAREKIETRLAIEVVSLRNKIEPGTGENWSFKIKDSKQEAEFLASMYDSSLDQFRTDSWKNISFRSYTTPEYPSFYDRNTINLSFDDLQQSSQYYKEYVRNPEIYWFGFDFINLKNSYTNRKYLEKIASIATIPSNAKKITGSVTDGFGPLPGANVVVKGTTRGVQTDLDGYFEIDAVKNEELVFSFIGMEDKIVKADSKTIKVKLNEGKALLEEVVVLGYDKIAKKTSTYSSVTVTSESLQSGPNSELLKSLQGHAAGLTISGGPGSATSVIIRGIGTINSNTELLYVVDGTISSREDFLKLNPGDLDSLIILKDASATAIYGNRAANGVIVISTKNGLKELTQVKTRTNFNETAFFYPDLTTDREGKISFSFTAPESLTKWSLRLYAHNKKAETGYFQTDVISQKEIMIMPNMPRFVREKDIVNISAKVINMTNKAKSGLAMLMLYDAANGKAIDSLSLNTANAKNFNCKPKESVALNWLISIPENVQGMQYKIVAKSGNFSDGEENILPVLANKILITESIPLWIKGNARKEYVFENFKNNTSTTLQHHSITLEYTSNPVWLAIQSLPYLMEYEHECAEQTFARYYANCIATEILNSSPKIADLFNSWKKEGNAKSRLNVNDELKSVILTETPWLMDAENEEEKNKRLAVLFDLNTLKESSDKTLKKLEEKLLPSGGFPWFDGGTEDNFISQHILSGVGHLCKLFPNTKDKYELIVSKGIPNIDAKFITSNTIKNKLMNPNYADLHYLYTRGFYLEKYPLSKKTDSIVSLQIKYLKKNWLDYSLYQKGILALVMHRYNEKDFAEKIITHLKETAASNADNGMYWIENSNSFYWYQSAIETQALLIEAFSEIENDREAIHAMKVWLIKNKQSKNWPTTKATTEAVYALLLQGGNWISIKDNIKIKIGNEKMLTKKLSDKEKESHTGYIKLNWKADEIDPKMYNISIDNKSNVPGFGGVYWQYFENTENIKTDSTAPLSVKKEVYKKVKTTEGDKLLSLVDEKIKVGDLLTIRLVVKSENNLEYVHLKDSRASCFEPVNVISKYHWTDNLNYYMSTKDVATHFFFEGINKGTYVLEYDVRVNNSGSFNDGIATIQSMYAPEFTAHSKSIKIISDN